MLKKRKLYPTIANKNKLEENNILEFLSTYEDIEDLKKGSSKVKEHNDGFIKNHLISEKNYLDSVLKEIDPNIFLDDEQRKVVLSDEDHTLVIAGAGAGKTTTVAAKVRYLVEKKGIDPKQILVISFTNKAVGELRERINEGLKIPCPITTFHSTGYAIIRKKDDFKKKIVTEGFLFNTVNEYLKTKVLDKPEMVEKLILFFGTYFNAPYEGKDLNAFFDYVSKSNFTTLKGDISEYNEDIIDSRTKKVTTITNETLRSMQEVQIANFLYLNKINYSYEETYRYHILKAKKPYTPDFTIRQGDKIAYIEHFGISEDGRNSRYTDAELSKYKDEINCKIKLHRKHGTNLIYTFSSYNDGRSLLEHLKEQLLKNGFTLEKRPEKEVYEKLVNGEENKYIVNLVKLICTFINNFKTDGYNIDDFYRFERNNPNERSKLFLNICRECYLEYQNKLSENDSVDFQDLINDSARIIREKEIAKEKLDFKYIIVDEYQDISQQRFDLVKELSTLCSAKIIAVGDDWQSIYAFSGSDVTLFTHFCSIMGYGEELQITKTYRNAQEVIDIAGNFIQKNESQIKKTLISPKHIEWPVIIRTYSERVDKKLVPGKGGRYYNLGKQLENIIGDILEKNKKEGKGINSPILLIGRYSFDARNLCYSEDFLYDENNGKVISKKYPQAKLLFLTAHSSKGLGYDNVVIVNAKDDLYGFPSQIDDDPVLQYVVREDKAIEYAEERRLFYVAMTRTKNRVYIITPEEKPSKFILEIIKDYPNVTLIGNIRKKDSFEIKETHRCPICGYPLKLRYKKNCGLKLWICTNEPEICNFMTNDLSGKDMSIEKCDRCKDGYLIVKKGVDGPILGCTNYKEDGTGCDRLLSYDMYKRWKTDGYEADPSMNLPSYKIETPKSIPLIKKVQKEDTIKTNNVAEPPKERKVGDVHKIKYKTKFIEKDGFSVVADENDNVITDMALLNYLRGLRMELSKKEKTPAYIIIGNSGLVSLSTYRPTTKEEFVALKGLGERTFEKYGKDFIDAIKEYSIKKENKQRKPIQ